MSPKSNALMSRISISMLLLGIFLVAAYAPLLLKGGIILDDWGDIAQTLNCNGYFNCYASWFPLFSNRPLAPLPITTSTLIFGLNTSWYLVFNTALYLGAIFIAAKTIKVLLTPFSYTFFIALSSIPVIAMPVIVSPINQSTATLAFLFWALSLHQLREVCLKNTWGNYFLTYFFLLSSLLTYEVMLPLLILNAGLPFILDSKLLRIHPFKYAAKFILPILAVLMLVLTWQKIIAPVMFEIVHSRLSFDPKNIGIFFLSWFDVFYTQLPELLIASSKRIKTFGYIISSILGALLIASWFEQTKSSKINGANKSVKARFALICIACFLASSSIFILSSSSAEIGGYQARALSSTWLCLILLFTSLINLAPKKILTLLLAVVFACLVYFAFAIQRDNYIRSWALQKHILNNALSEISLQNVPPEANIIGNVPRYLSNNFNNELVFSQPWDFGAALFLYTNKRISGGAVIDTRGSDFSKPLKLSNGILSIDNWWKSDTTNLWFYDYDPSVKSGTLKRIQDIDSLKKLLVSIGYLGEFESKSYVTTNSPILFANDWLDRSKYIISGWGERESWGGIWSTQDRATIKLPIPEDGAKSIIFNVNAFVSSNHPSQEVLVFINGHLQGKVNLNKFEGNTFSIPLPSIENHSLPITIDFEFPNAISPKDLKLGEDNRKLGIGLKTATYQ